MFNRSFYRGVLNNLIWGWVQFLVKKLCYRTSLLICICMAMSRHFILENPRSSLMFEYMMEVFSAIKSMGRKATWEKVVVPLSFHGLSDWN